MKKSCLLISFLLISFHSIACLNGKTKTLKNGAHIYEDHRGIIPQGHNFYIQDYPEVIKKLDSLYKATKDLDYLSDKGYLLIIQQKYTEAVALYLKIEQLKPGRYATASNLGTAYELMGENQKALDWINKAIEIDPKSHNGSEWLHAKILQAKITGIKYINSDFLINTNFGFHDQPENKMSKADRKALIKALYFQLNERVSFIKSEDPIIALLLFDLGNLAFLDGDYISAKYIYEKSAEYGLKSDLLKNRIHNADWKIKEKLYNQIYALKANNRYYQILFIVTLIVGSLVIVALSIILFSMKRKYKQRLALAATKEE